MKDYIQAFLGYMADDARAAANTVAAYRGDLMGFAEHVGDRGPKAISLQLIREYKARLHERYGLSTVSRKLSALRSFFEWLQAEGAIRVNPAEKIRLPRVKRPLPQTLSANEVEWLLYQPTKLGNTHPIALRDRALLELLYATGLGVSEIIRLDLDDISAAARTVHCRGKGKKDRILPISEIVAMAIAEYLVESRPYLVRSLHERAYFVSKSGLRLERSSVWLILKRYAKEASITKPVTSHTLRHSFAAEQRRQGVPVEELQRLLGHSKVATTQVYEQLVVQV